ncbi:MAG TPA: hypothetical protein VFZ09_28325 [Archangium sp.]|nr:hypothetical protein [Archangium sp.]HEX5750170.1 hypothetical protein [Archangium sp.]
MAKSREWTYRGPRGQLVARTWSGSQAPSEVLAHVTEFIRTQLTAL